MPKKYFTFKDFSGGLNLSEDPRDIKDNELAEATDVMVDKRGHIRTMGGFQTHTEVPTLTGSVTPGYGLFVFNSDFKTGAAAADTGENYLVLADVLSGQLDIYDKTGDSWSLGDVDLGVITSRAYGAGNLAFPTDTTITDSGNTFISSGHIRTNALIRVSNATLSGNNRVFLVIKTEAGTLTIDGTVPLTIDSVDSNDVVIEVLPRITFYAFGNSFRAIGEPRPSAVALKQQWYGFIDRDHFQGLGGPPEFSPDNWFAKANNILKPSDLGSDGTNGSGGSYPTAGVGLDFGIIKNAGVGEWTAEPDGTAQTWEMALSFIYDDLQESLLHIPASAITFTTLEEDSLTITVRAETSGTDYDERITHARAYCRKQGSTNPWILLVDISLRDGARASLASDYVKWNANTDKVYTDNFNSLAPNLDTYEGLTGHFHDGTQISLGVNNGDGYNDAVVGGNTVYLLGPQYIDTKLPSAKDSGDITHLRDRIIHTPPNQPDKFPAGYFIDVTTADAAEYTAGLWYNNKLFAFKETSLQVINPATEEVELYPFKGVFHKGAVVLTRHGPVWGNASGCFVYRGPNNIVNLIDGKIPLTTDWEFDFFSRTAIVGYSQKYDTLVIRSASTSINKQLSSDFLRGYVYDFRVGSWTFVFDFVLSGDNLNITNFQTDWNGDLVMSTAPGSGSGTVRTYYWTDGSLAKGNSVAITTKEVDFGNPAIQKVIDLITITYKSSVEQVDKVSYAKDGSTSFTTLTGTLAATSSWAELVIQPTPFDVYSIRIRINKATGSGVLDIKSITIRYREKRLDIS